MKLALFVGLGVFGALYLVVLPAGSRAELKDYKHSGYDRGHQAPSGDETKKQSLQNDTYFLSNMVPQIGQFNQHAWEGLEEMVRGWAIARGEAYVITGPMFYDPKEDDPHTATAHFTIKAIGKDHVVCLKLDMKIFDEIDGVFLHDRRAIDQVLGLHQHAVEIERVLG